MVKMKRYKYAIYIISMLFIFYLVKFPEGRQFLYRHFFATYEIPVQHITVLLKYFTLTPQFPLKLRISKFFIFLRFQRSSPELSQLFEEPSTTFV